MQRVVSDLSPSHSETESVIREIITEFRDFRGGRNLGYYYGLKIPMLKS